MIDTGYFSPTWVDQYLYNIVQHHYHTVINRILYIISPLSTSGNERYSQQVRGMFDVCCYFICRIILCVHMRKIVVIYSKNR